VKAKIENVYLRPIFPFVARFIGKRSSRYWS